MRKVSVILLMIVLLVSCAENKVEIKPNESIVNAIEILNSVTEAEEVTIELSGKTTAAELRRLKQALVALEYKSIGNGFVNVDMTELSGTEEMDSQYFGNMKMLKSVKLPETMTEVPKFIFYRCKYLKEVTVGKDTTCIGYSAFQECESLEKLNLQSEKLEVKKYAFVELNPLVEVKKQQNLTMYYFDGPVFDNSLNDIFYPCFPTTEPIDVSRTFISKEGNLKTLNLSLQYSSDSDYVYLSLKNNDKPQNGTKKILTMIKPENKVVNIAETDIDGFLAEVPQGFEQKIKITQPDDGSKWYITKNQEVFYSWDKGRAYAIPFTEELVVDNSYREYYFFKAK